MLTLPTQEQVQAEFDAARDEGISPCAWMPPAWEKTKPLDADGKRRELPNNSADGGEQFGFQNPAANQTGDERIKAGDAKKEPGNPESRPNKEHWTNPFADFTHVDDDEFPAKDLGAVEQALAGKPDELAILGRLKRIVGAGSPGMERLGLIFEWALYRTTELMRDINLALDQWNPKQQNSGKTEYDEARDNYIKFLRDLDNHEPGKGYKTELKVKDKKSPSGYGRALKWACIDPVIFNGRIVGARVIIHWNPHSSSNGIPIPHSP